MVKDIRIHIEGGGKEGFTKAKFRIAFRQFLRAICEAAEQRGIHIDVVMCGDRARTFRAFKKALDAHPDAFNVLLVDSEGPVTDSNPWAHLKRRDKWRRPSAAGPEQCHLMAQTMEAWLIADRKALIDFYGNGFSENALSNRPNVEEIPKPDLEKSLKKASHNTQKGDYHKTRHAPRILEKLRLSEVCDKAKHCRRLVETLQEQINPDRNSNGG